MKSHKFKMGWVSSSIHILNHSKVSTENQLQPQRLLPHPVDLRDAESSGNNLSRSKTKEGPYMVQNAQATKHVDRSNYENWHFV